MTSKDDMIRLAHGGGGRATRRLLDSVVLPILGEPERGERRDAAVVDLPSGEKLAFTTDAFVVKPLFFPGGDIGSLAVYGTVNDLAMVGAKPHSLSLAMILEEGTPIETLERVLRSIDFAQKKADVRVVTGDTKVVERGHGDGIFLATTGIGIVPSNVDIRPSRARPGDAIVVSGDLGRHGIALMSVREGLSFGSDIESDCAPVATDVARLLKEGVEIHSLRDLTRGGLVSALVELSTDGRFSCDIEDSMIPLSDPVKSACELLGLDPLSLPNEGTFLVIVPHDHLNQTLSILSSEARQASHIGFISDGPSGQVVLRTAFGTKRVLDLPLGELLPRIC